MEEDIRDIRALLNEEIASEIQIVSNLELGSKEHTAAVGDLAKLYQLRIDESKNEWDADEKHNQRIMEDETNARDEAFRQTQIAEQIKDRYFRVGIATAELIVPLIFYGIWMRKGFKFEETGAYTSTTFKGLFNRFKPTKK
jgi:hypothetical protein